MDGDQDLNRIDGDYNSSRSRSVARFHEDIFSLITRKYNSGTYISPDEARIDILLYLNSTVGSELLLLQSDEDACSEVLSHAAAIYNAVESSDWEMAQSLINSVISLWERQPDERNPRGDRAVINGLQQMLAVAFTVDQN